METLIPEKLGPDSRDQAPEEDNSRRRFLKLLGLAPIAVAAAVPGILAPRTTRAIEVTHSLIEIADAPVAAQEPERIETASEMTDAATDSFIKIFEAYGESVFFVDDDYVIVGGQSFTKPSKREFKNLRKKRQTSHRTYGAFLQAWINEKRGVLKEQNPEIDFSLKKGQERPRMTRGTGAIEEALRHGGRLFDNLLEHFDAGLAGTDFALDYPELLEHVSGIFVFGVAAHETKYRNLDNGQARGLWQFTPDTAKECGLTVDEKNDDRTNHKRSSRAAAMCLDRIYSYLKKTSSVIDVMDDFSVSAEDFLVPCIVDAYHAGIGNVKAMLEWFSKNYTRDIFEAEFGQKNWGKDLYFLMSKLYSQSGKSGSYKDGSRAYCPAVMAMHKALTGEYYGEAAKAPGKTYVRKSFTETTVKRNFLGAALLAIGSTVAASALSVLGSLPGNKPITRRRFFTRCGALGILSAGSTAAGMTLKDEEILIENKQRF